MNDTRTSKEPEPDESDADTCRLAFQAWANDLELCLDEIFMSSDGVPEHPYEDNDTNQFWRAWLASWKAQRAAQPPRPPLDDRAWVELTTEEQQAFIHHASDGLCGQPVQPPEAWRPKSEPIPAEAFAFTYGDYWINLPPHPQIPTSTKGEGHEG